MRYDRPVIELPRLIDVRPKALDHLESTLKRLSLKGTALLLVGQITNEVAGNRIVEILENSPYEVHTHFVDNATIKEAETTISAVDEYNADFILAAGGGTKIDVAKYSSFKSDIPFISIPTVASHDGIASARASLEGMDSKHSFEAHSPMAVVGDVNIVSQAPRRYTISGCADIISNKTAVLDWKFSNRLTGEHISQYSMTLSELIASTMIDSKKVIANDPVLGAYTVLKGLITSSMAMCIAGSSRPASGAEHMISHRLDHITGNTALHGEQTGLGSIISMYLHGGDWKEIRDVLKYIGAPVTAKELGFSRDQMIDALSTAHSIRPDRFTILGKSGISREASENALLETNIID